MLANEKMVKDKVEVNNIGLMVLFIKAIEKTTWLMAKVV